MDLTTTEIRHFQVGMMKVEVYPSRAAAGEAAARAAADAILEFLQKREIIAVIFATGASQLDMLSALTSMHDLPWERISGFHLDEYVGVSPDHPASFRRYLRDRLTSKVKMK